MEQKVVIQVGDCTLTLMPSLGGKISSLRIGNEELLQSPLRPYLPRTASMPFSESDASGWDECLPSVAPCRIETPVGAAIIPDHGDLWRIPWLAIDLTKDSATMRANCSSLPLQLTRSLILSETATGWQIQLLYSLINLGAFPVPWSWAAHPLFAAEAGDRIELPESVNRLRLEGSANQRLGLASDFLSWPIAECGNGTRVDLSEVAGPASGIGDKLFAGPFQQTPAWAALVRRRAGLRLRVGFDAARTPYLGMWLCYGGWPEGSGKKQVCVALEPATAPVDSLAQPGPWSRMLEPGEICTWPMELLIDRIADLTPIR